MCNPEGNFVTSASCIEVGGKEPSHNEFMREGRHYAFHYLKSNSTIIPENVYNEGGQRLRVRLLNGLLSSRAT